jgi:hypothetical protein
MRYFKFGGLEAAAPSQKKNKPVGLQPATLSNARSEN